MDYKFGQRYLYRGRNVRLIGTYEMDCAALLLEADDGDILLADPVSMEEIPGSYEGAVSVEKPAHLSFDTTYRCGALFVTLIAACDGSMIVEELDSSGDILSGNIFRCSSEQLRPTTQAQIDKHYEKISSNY